MASILRPGNIKEFTINGKNGSADLSGSKSEHNSKSTLADIRYYENVLSNIITLTVGIKETDDLLDKLPIRGGEKVDIILEDYNGRKLKPTLHVNRVRNVVSDSLENNYFLDLASEQYFKNNLTRVVKRYDGKISESVKKIMKEKLDADVDVDETLINYNFIGNNRKPLYVCTWLASKSVPAKPGEGTAGYLFFETQDGFQFKSIDGLFSQEPKRNYVLTNTPFKPDEYDSQILKYSIDRDIDLQNNLAVGLYSNRSIYFNFYDFNYKDQEFNIKNEVVKTGGKNSISVENFGDEPSRIMTRILDIGTLPAGKTSKDELETWKSDPTNPTYNAPKTMVQSVMRYNQLFTIKINITVAADFTLKAGDLVHCDFPEVNTSKSSGLNKESSGIYMIASLCHRLTSDQSSTTLTLVRESFGRQPF
tara:strand:+ start:562 stop:1824 length:1263 start_codon:yes stop_codon:yes gene_type:complete